MSNATYAREGYTAFLNSLTSDLGLVVRLYTNDPPISADSVRDDFVEATHFGYEPFFIGRWTPALLRDGAAITVPDIPQFLAVGPSYGLPIVGVFVTHGNTGPLALAWRRPDPPFQFSATNKTLTVFLRIDFPFAAGGG